MSNWYTIDQNKERDGGKYNRTINSPLWRYGKVISTDDPEQAGRIKIWVDGWDDSATSSTGSKLPSSDILNNSFLWSQPLLPKHLNIIPMDGDIVKVSTFDYRNPYGQRFYIPVTSQIIPERLERADYDIVRGELSGLEKSGNDLPGTTKKNTKLKNWKLNPLSSLDNNMNWAIYPKKEDIALIGRINTDLILRDTSKYSEIMLRVGKINPKSINAGQTYDLNIKNPAYISINFTKSENTFGSFSDLNIEKSRSHINLIADNLNLISHKGSNIKGSFLSNGVIIEGSNINGQIKMENNQLHPLVYGDILWDFLSVLRPYIEGHVHKASRREPDSDLSKNNLIKWFNDNMGAQVSKPNPDGTSYVDIEDCTFLSKGVKTN
jgi:hypothetical protein